VLVACSAEMITIAVLPHSLPFSLTKSCQQSFLGGKDLQNSLVNQFEKEYVQLKYKRINENSSRED
jgi:hypothetical protein